MKRGLCEICNPKQWKTISSDMLKSEGYPVYGANGVIGYFSEYNHKKATLLITCRGATCGALNICEPFSYVNGNAMALDDLSPEVDLKYLYYYLLTRGLSDTITGSAQPQIVRHSLQKVEVFYPQLDEQRRIAAVLDKVSDLIAKRREQLDKLDELVKARFVEMFGDPEFNLRNWPIVSVSDVCTVGSSKRIYQGEQTFDGVPFVRISDLNHLIDTGDFCPSLFISEEKYQELQQHGQVPIEGDILVTSRGTLGRCYIIKTTDRFYFQDGMISWISNLSNEITSLFIAYLFDMQSIKRQIESMQAGSTVSYLSIDMIKRLKIMLPDRNLQKQFGAFVDQTNKSKLTIQQSLDKLEVLKKALMQQYFG